MSVASDLSASIELLSSPALSAASYDVVQVSDGSDDEIVWSPAASSASISFSQPDTDDDDDFIVLGGPALRRQPLTGVATEVSTPVRLTLSLPVEAVQEPATLTPQDSEPLAQALTSRSEIPIVGAFPTVEPDDTPPRSPSPGASWTTDSDVDSSSGSTSSVSDVQTTSQSKVSVKKRSRKSNAKAKAKSRTGSTPSPTADAPPSSAPAKAPAAKKVRKSKKRSGPKNKKAAPVQVTATSETAIKSVPTADQPTMYQEAASFISSFLSNPKAKESKVCRLTLLQSLIIELGINTASGLPTSLRAAKAILKSKAFVNIREYLAVRQDGPEALKSIMHPSKSALIRSLKRNKNASPVSWVKGQGLQVLLVGWMH